MHIAPVCSGVEGINKGQIDLIDALKTPRPDIASLRGSGAGSPCLSAHTLEAALGHRIDQVVNLDVQIAESEVSRLNLVRLHKLHEKEFR
jgi:hypothetical protein